MRASALALAACAWCAAARADEDPRARARAYSETARDSFSRGDFAAAHEDFARAYDLAPIPDLLYDLAVCEERLGRFGDAAHSFERYLATVGQTRERAALEQRIADLKAREAGLAGGAAASSRPIPRPESEHRPVWRRAWFWAVLAVAALAVAGAITLAVLLSPSPSSRYDYPPVTF